MAVFSGIYSWDGKKEDSREPISWFPGAYNLKIINLATSSSVTTYLKPYMCLFTNTGSGYSVSANPEKFAKRICEDFSLEIEKVLWVERVEQDSDEYDVILFKKRGVLGTEVFYTMEKRKPIPGELKLIQRELIAKV